MHKGYEGDCVEIMPTLEETPQLIICDGPFGFRMNPIEEGGTGEVIGTKWFDICCDIVDSNGTIAVFVPTTCLQTYHYTNMCNKRHLSSTLTWTHNGWNDIERGTDSTDETRRYTSNILIFGQTDIRPEYIGHYPIEELTYHPHQKPVGTYQYLIDNYSKDGDTILDPFAGSGICAKACTNRNYIAIDFDIEPFNKVQSTLV